VEREGKVGGQEFDLLAERDGQLLVFEVKARSRLGESVDEVARLRAAAIEAGVDGFRLVVVSPPRQTDVAIEGLEGVLKDHFLTEVPPEIDALSYQTDVNRVRLSVIDSIDVRHEGIHVQGKAVLYVQLNFRGKTDRIDLSVEEGLGFEFDVELGQDLKLSQVHSIKVDLSDFADDEADLPA
jgi:hypothetical protein